MPPVLHSAQAIEPPAAVRRRRCRQLCIVDAILPVAPVGGGGELPLQSCQDVPGVAPQLNHRKRRHQQGHPPLNPAPAPLVERAQQRAQGLDGQVQHPEGEQEGIAEGEPVGPLEQVPHPVQRGEQHRRGERRQQPRVCQPLPQGELPEKEVDERQRQHRRAAKYVRGRAVADGLILPAPELAQQVQGGAGKQPVVVHIAAAELAVEHGQEGGQPQPRRQPQRAARAAEKAQQHRLQRRPARLHGDKPDTQVQRAEGPHHIGDVPGGDEAGRQRRDEGPRAFPRQNPLQRQQDQGQPDHPVQPHHADGIHHVVGHQGVAHAAHQAGPTGAVKPPPGEHGEAHPRQPHLPHDEEHQPYGHVLVGHQQGEQGQRAGHVIGKHPDVTRPQGLGPGEEQLSVFQRAEKLHVLAGHVGEQDGPVPPGSQPQRGVGPQHHRRRDEKGQTVDGGHGHSMFRHRDPLPLPAGYRWAVF